MAGIEAHRGSKGTGGAAQRGTASRKGAREVDFRRGRKTATFALEMEIVAHAAGVFNDGEVEGDLELGKGTGGMRKAATGERWTKM